MAQVSETTSAVPATAPAAAVEASVRAHVQAVSGAVKILNDAGHAGQGREVTFSVDRATRLPVVKVVDKDTKEVLQQWPSDYVLQLAEAYKQEQRNS